MTPNRFLAVVDTDKCKGCQDCIDRCKFDAIEMEKDTHSKKLKATISAEKCKGCGLCVMLGSAPVQPVFEPRAATW